MFFIGFKVILMILITLLGAVLYLLFRKKRPFNIITVCVSLLALIVIFFINFRPIFDLDVSESVCFVLNEEATINSFTSNKIFLEIHRNSFLLKNDTLVLLSGKAEKIYGDEIIFNLFPDQKEGVIQGIYSKDLKTINLSNTSTIILSKSFSLSEFDCNGL